jgi:hypothetical protein
MTKTYDTQAIREKTDCMNLMELFFGQATRKRDYYASYQCPFCGRKNKNNFTAWKDCWKCWKGCGEGDAIKLVMQAKQCDFRAACEFLGGELQPSTFADKMHSKPVSMPIDEPPNPHWIEDATDILERAQKKLWSPEGKMGMDYLLGRGLTPDSIKRFGFGYIPPYHDPKNYYVHGIRVFHGVLIPSFRDNHLWNARFRTFSQQPEYRYLNMPYGKLLGSLWGGDRLAQWEPLILCEGDFNAAILCQLGYQAVSTSAATNKVTPYWYKQLITAPYVLVWGDNDKAGQKFNEDHCAISPLFKAVTSDLDANDLYQKSPDSLTCLVDSWLESYTPKKHAPTIPPEPPKPEPPIEIVNPEPVTPILPPYRVKLVKYDLAKYWDRQPYEEIFIGVSYYPPKHWKDSYNLAPDEYLHLVASGIRVEPINAIPRG